MAFGFTHIIAWQKAHKFVLSVYKITKTYPEFEKYGLCSQFQRAAVSVTANIAEGYRKLSKADKLRFFNISQGSLSECCNYIILSRDLGYIDVQQFEQLRLEIEETSKLINSYCSGILNNNGIKDE